MSKHTPGPWKYNANTRGIGAVDTSDTQSYGMMLVVAYIDECDHSEYAANARLIAAAPDLLEALKDLCSHINETRGSNADNALFAARLAIAKATGENLC